MVKLLTLPMAALCMMAPDGSTATDGADVGSFYFKKCPTKRLYVMFSLDKSGSMSDSGRMTGALDAIRNTLYEVYVQTTLPCLEWEAQDPARRGACMDNGFTTMVPEFWAWSSFASSYYQLHGHNNIVSTWYEYEMDPSSSTYNSVNVDPVMTVEKIKTAYQNAGSSAEDQKTARDAIKSEIKNNIIDKTDVLPYVTPGGSTDPSTGTSKMKDYVINNNLGAQSAQVVTFQLTDGYVSTGEAERCKGHVDAMNAHMAAGTQASIRHYGLGVAGSVSTQKAYYDGCGVATDSSSFVTDGNIANLVQTVVSQTLQECATCVQDLATGEVSGGGICGGADVDDTEPSEQQYFLRDGKYTEVGITPTYGSSTGAECQIEQLQFSSPDNQKFWTFEDVKTCKVKNYKYCANALGDSVQYEACGIPTRYDDQGDIVDYFIVSDGQLGEAVNDCECADKCSLDTYCSPSAGSPPPGYLDNLRAKLATGDGSSCGSGCTETDNPDAAEPDDEPEPEEPEEPEEEDGGIVPPPVAPPVIDINTDDVTNENNGDPDANGNNEGTAMPIRPSVATAASAVVLVAFTMSTM